MKCPICDNNASFYKAQNLWFCHVCNKWIDSPQPDNPVINPQKPFIAPWETANNAAALGIATALIGLFIVFICWEILILWPVALFFMLIWGCFLPICGAILILMKHYKIGGYIQIIGSALLVPAGIIGIYGGKIALSLADRKER